MARLNVDALSPFAEGDDNAAAAIAASKADSGAADSELVRIPLNQIGDRPAGDTRPINDAQVESLVESIKAVGLIAPLAVDNQNRLLAGGHRRAALQRLMELDLPLFNDLFPGGVPCRKFNFDSTAEAEQALQIEISENEKRRNYTRAEILAVANRLKEQGYSQDRGRGNIKPLAPALELAFGVSRSTVQRALKQSNESRDTFESKPKTRSLRVDAGIAELLEQRANARGQTISELLMEFLQAP